MEDFNIIAETVPSGICVQTNQDIVDLVQNYAHVQFNETYALFNFGASTPPVDQQDRPWLKLNADGSFDDVYVYFNGAWTPKERFAKGDIIMTTGTEAASNVDPWRSCVAGIGTVHSVDVPDLSDRFIIGAGNTYEVGDMGGENTVTLDATTIPSHQHTIPCYGPVETTPDLYGTVAAPGTARVTEPASSSTSTLMLSSNVGGGQAHENKPLYYALLYKIYVGYS